MLCIEGTLFYKELTKTWKKLPIYPEFVGELSFKPSLEVLFDLIKRQDRHAVFSKQTLCFFYIAGP
jgi:hypothetical protein